MIQRKNHPPNWYDGIRQETSGSGRLQRYPMPPYSKEELESRSEIIWNNIRLVKIPREQGVRILPRQDGQSLFRSVEYIYERTYQQTDRRKKESRNQKAIIGQEIEEVLPGWMIPTENYDRYFDRNGVPIQTEDKKQEEPSENNNRQNPEDHPQKPEKNIEDNKLKHCQEYQQESQPKNHEPTLRSGSAIESNDHLDETQPQAPFNVPEGTEASNTHDYYHTAPRSKKQTERLLTEMLAEAAEALRMQELQRLQSIPEEEMTEEEREACDEEQQNEILRQKKEIREQLRRLFFPQHRTIETQAKKHPDQIVSPFKVHKLNQLLEKLRELYRETEYEEYLDLIEEPETDEEGNILSGMTYSDVDVLMNSYNAALEDYKVFGI